jgi:integrase
VKPASFLTRRGVTFFFQRRVPANLQYAYGSSPLRIRLPAIGWRQAALYAHPLAAITDIRFHMTASTPDGDLDHSEILREQLLDAYRKLIERLSNGLVDSLQTTEYLQNFLARIPPDQSISTELARHDLGNLFERQNNNIISMADGLREILEADQAQFAAKHPSANQRSATTERLTTANDLGTLNGLLGTLQTSVTQVEQKIDQSHQAIQAITANRPEIPHLDDAIENFVTFKRLDLKPDSKEPDYFEHRLLLMRDFLQKECGKQNPRIDNITADDITALFSLLPFIPQRHSVFPELRDMTLLNAIKYNRSLPEDGKYRGLAQSTGEDQYVDKYKTFFMWAARRYAITDPFSYAIPVPHFLRQEIIREPLSVQQLNRLFEVAAFRENPGEVWIPVLAFFTGARLGELVYLQKTDLEQRDGKWILNLTRNLITEVDGSDDDNEQAKTETTATKGKKSGKKTEQRRPLKTVESRRIVALHEAIEALGFLHWLENCDNGFVFPALHRAQHKSNAASKRMRRIFVEAEIYSELKHVFHSLRHGYRDLMLDNDIREETAEKQLGHMPSSQTRRYGSRLLRPREIERLEKMELPKGLSFEPYYRVLDQVLYYGRLVSAKRYEKDLIHRQSVRQFSGPAAARKG